MIHRRGFRASHRMCAASQRVAGPYGRPYCMYLIVSGSDTCISQWSGIRGGMRDRGHMGTQFVGMAYRTKRGIFSHIHRGHFSTIFITVMAHGNI